MNLLCSIANLNSRCPCLASAILAVTFGENLTPQINLPSAGLLTSGWSLLFVNLFLRFFLRLPASFSLLVRVFCAVVRCFVYCRGGISCFFFRITWFLCHVSAFILCRFCFSNLGRACSCLLFVVSCLCCLVIYFSASFLLCVASFLTCAASFSLVLHRYFLMLHRLLLVCPSFAFALCPLFTAGAASLPADAVLFTSCVRRCLLLWSLFCASVSVVFLASFAW